MTRDHERDSEPEADQSIYKVPNAPPDVSADAIKQVTDFAENGKGAAKDMPRLLHAISNHDKNNSEIQFLLPKLAKRMDGDLFLQCAAGFSYVSYFAISVALEDASPPATDAAVRKYLRSRSVSELLDLDIHGPMLAKVQKLLPGPLAQELPVLAEIPDAMQAKQNIMRWYIDSTPAPVVAIALASRGSELLATTLDAIDRWSWLDALKIGGGVWNSHKLRALKATKNKGAQDRLDAILKNAPDAAAEDTTAYQSKARAELNATIEGDVSTPELLDMTARAGGLDMRPEREMKSKIKGKPAGDVLQFAVASNLSLAEGIQLLLASPDVEAVHVLALFTEHSLYEERVNALKDDRLRPKIRKAVGRSVPLLSFFNADILDYIHPLIVKDEALLQWALEVKDPRTYLFVAAGSAAGEKQGLAAVKAAKGLDWIYSLPIDSPPDQLRRLSMIVQDKPKKHIEQLIGDKKIEHAADDFTTQASKPTLWGGGDRARFDVATRIDGTSEEEILGRVSDLEPDERAAVARDSDALAATLARLNGDNVQRAVYQLAPTIAQLFATKIGYSPRLLGYIHTRSTGEQIAVTSKPGTIKRAKEIFGQSPFVILPALLDPNVLAKALDANDDLLAWILADAEPNQALAVLSREPARARAAAAFENDYSLYNRFPKYRHLLPEGKAGADAIVKDIHDQEAADEGKAFQQSKSEPPTSVDEAGKALQDARKADHLWDALIALDDKADSNAALALVRAYPKDQLALLSGAHSTAVRKLRRLAYVAPQIAFPQIPIAQLLVSPDALSWLLGFEAPFVVLHHVAGKDPALRQLGRLIDENSDEVSMWLDGLPRGANLEAVERGVLDDLRAHVSNLAVLHRLFAIRFGVSIASGFDAKRSRELWAVLRRLPPAQINQQATRGFVQDEHAGAPGYWGDPDVVMSSDEKQFKQPDKAYDKTPMLTKAEIMGYYGLDEAKFKAALDPAVGWISEEGGKYRVKEVKTEKFRATALHEIGHSIDTLLGERTELVFSVAGWKTHGLDQIEEWANDMNALDGLPAKHKDKVIEAWRHSVRSGTPVSDLVQSDHPAVDPALAHVPLVAAGIEGSTFNYKDRREVKGRVGLTGSNQGTISSVPKATADIAPSEYSLYAPGEFFAECYVEYYRDYDGTAGTKTAKGGRLPPSLRDWFDKHVDTIELNPQRYAKPDGDGAAPAPGKK